MDFNLALFFIFCRNFRNAKNELIYKPCFTFFLCQKLHYNNKEPKKTTNGSEPIKTANRCRFYGTFKNKLFLFNGLKSVATPYFISTELKHATSHDFFNKKL